MQLDWLVQPGPQDQRVPREVSEAMVPTVLQDLPEQLVLPEPTAPQDLPEPQGLPEAVV